MDISSRLQAERKRMGLTQEALAVKLEATKRSVINWEGGAALPGAEVLSRYAAAGADVLYILTGQRTGGAAAPAPARALARDEEILLDNFRNCPPDARAAIKATSNALARAAGGCKRDKAA